MPTQEAYLNKGNPTYIRSLGAFREPNTRFGLSQHNEMVVIIRNLLTSTPKDNLYVEKCLTTGILRLSIKRKYFFRTE